MQQLLEITTTAMKYELEIESARLDYKQDFQPRANVQTTPSSLQVQTSPTRLRIDTYNARRSIGFAKVGDRIRDAAEKGSASIREYTRNAVDMGQQMARIADGVTIGEIIKQKMLAQPSMYTAFLPSSGANVSWEPNKIAVDYKAGRTNYDWQIRRNAMSYVPGSVQLRITQYPKIEISYMGSPLYVPPSAAPNYEQVG